MSTGDAVDRSPKNLDTGDARGLAIAAGVVLGLRQQADQLLPDERQGRTLQPTALMHAALRKLLGRPSLRFGNLPETFAIPKRASGAPGAVKNAGRTAARLSIGATANRSQSIDLGRVVELAAVHRRLSICR